MITCYLRHVIDPYKAAEFERYARMVIPLAAKYGGTQHGYFLSHEGPNNVAVNLFSFPTLADYEPYRTAVREDEVGERELQRLDDVRDIPFHWASLLKDDYEQVDARVTVYDRETAEVRARPSKLGRLCEKVEPLLLRGRHSLAGVSYPAGGPAGRAARSPAGESAV